jgi:hypothetical protein
MRRSASKREQLDLLTASFNYKMLVGETVIRFLLLKDLIIEEEPAREKGKPFPLGDPAAWVSFSDIAIQEKDKIKLRGKVEGKAIFYSVRGPEEKAWLEEEFTREIVIPGVLPGMEVGVHGRICYLGEEETPVEAEGKILYQLKIEVEALLSVADPHQLNVAVGVKDVPAEKIKRGVIVAEELLGEKVFPLTVTREYEFEEELNFVKAINYYIKDFTWNLEDNGVSFRGELATTFYYLAGEMSGFRDNRQQFSGRIDFPGLKKGMEVRFFPRVEYATYQTTGKTVNETAYLDIFLRATRAIQQDVICDIQGYAVKKELLLLPKSTGVLKEPLEVVQKLSFPYPREIAGGPGRFLILDVIIQADLIEVAGTLEKNIYYLTGRNIDDFEEDLEKEIELLPAVLKTKEDFQSTLSLPGAGENTITAEYYHIDAAEFAPAENATLQISRASLEIKTWEMQELYVVIPHRVPPGTSMVVYSVRQGDTLLKIARSYGVLPEVITEANDLGEDAVLEKGQKLLIPLFY